jgi:thioredoxin-related protein
MGEGLGDIPTYIHMNRYICIDKYVYIYICIDVWIYVDHVDQQYCVDV